MKGLFRLFRWKHSALVCLCLVIALAGILFARISVTITANRTDILTSPDDANPYLYSQRVLRIQKKLNRTLSFNLRNYTPIAENGFWNSNTAIALEQFRDMYHRKYRLQRYYAFSASAGTPNLSGAEGLLDREIPNPAGFAREYAEGLKLKLGDPAKYYGNGALDEIRRIEKGLLGDFVDPVTGELSKTIPLYTTPAGNAHLLPISLALRYGSQYPGNSGTGTGWFLTENASLWYSYEKNEMVVQDPAGVSQKYELSGGTNFVRKGETTDGGYFVSVTLDGEIGVPGSRIVVKTAVGDTLEFEIAESTGGDSVKDVKAKITEPIEIMGYRVTLQDSSITNISFNREYTNIRKEEYSGGIFADFDKSVDTSHGGTVYVDESSMIQNKAGLLTLIDGHISDNMTGEWTVSLFSARHVSNRIIQIRLPGYTNEFAVPVYDQYQAFNYRRNGTNDQNIYAGYVHKITRNRFRARKEYRYDAFQKLCQVDSYSPGNRLVDQVSVFYRGSEGNTNRGESLSYEELRDQKSVQGSEPVSLILGPSGFRAELAYDGEKLTRLTRIASGRALVYDMRYLTEFIRGDTDGIYNKLVSGKEEMEDAIESMEKQARDIAANKDDYIKGEKTVDSGLKFLWVFPVSTTIKTTDSYWDLYIKFIWENISELRRNLAQVNRQISDYYSGKLFPKTLLLYRCLENNRKWTDYAYSNYVLAGYSNTNVEQSHKLVELTPPSGRPARFTYTPGTTVFRNPLGRDFRFDYSLSETNYAERRVTNISYPGNARVSIAYDRKGNITALTNEIGSVYSYEYDGFGNVTVKNVPGGRSWTNTYGHDAAKFLGRPTQIRQPDGSRFEMTYDTNGELLTQVLYADGKQHPLSSVTFENISGGGYRKTSRDMFNASLVEIYDADHNLVRLTQPDGGVTTYSNDNFGKPLYVTREGFDTQFTEYDSDGRVTARGISGVNRAAVEYGAWGEKVKVVDPLGTAMFYEYDASLRQTRVVFPNNYFVRYDYDADGNKTVETYLSGPDNEQKILYAYDALSRLTNRTLWHGNESPHNVAYLYEYDPAGSLVRAEYLDSVSGTNRKVFLYQYDGIGLLAREEDQAAGLIAVYRYNSVGQQTNAVIRKNGTYSEKIQVMDALSRPLATLTRNTPDGAFVSLESNDYRDGSHSVIKTDSYGRESVTHFDFRNNPTNLAYGVFNPLTGGQEAYVHAYRYDRIGNKTMEVYPDGTVLEWAYVNGSWPEKESRRRFVSESPAWRVNRFDAAGRVTESVDFAGKTWRKSYDVLGFVAVETDPEGRRITYQRDLFGNPLEMIRGGFITRMRYNLSGKPVEILHPEGQNDRIIYDAFGNPAVTIPGGVESMAVRAEFDSQGRKVYEILPYGLETVRDYDADGNILRETAKSGTNARTRQNEYDSLGRLTREIMPDGAVVLHAYALSNGLLVSTITRGRETSVTVSDQMNRVIRTVLSDDSVRTDSDVAFYSGRGIVSGKAFNKAGLPVLELSPGNRTRGFAYAADGRILSETNAVGEVKTMAYNANGQLTEMTDFDVNVYHYEYDASGKMAKSINPGSAMSGGETLYRYDAAGNLSEKREPSGALWKYAYDSRGRVIREENPYGGVRTAEFGETGALLRETAANGSVTEYVYGAGGILQSVKRPSNAGKAPFVTSYSINAFGETNSVVNPDGGTVTARYDPLGRKIAETRSGGGKSYTHSYVYTPEGRLDSTVRPDGLAEKVEYSASGLVLSRSVLTNPSTPLGTGSGGVKVREIRYDYSAGGLAYGLSESVTDWRGLRVVSYFDRAGRVTNRIETSAAVPGTGGGERRTVTEYGKAREGDQYYRTVTSWQDNAGRTENWTRETRDFRGNSVRVTGKIAGTERILSESDFNASGQVVSEKIYRSPERTAVTAYEYDARGLLVKKTEPSGLVSRYVYDVSGRVTAVDMPSGRSARFEYHPSGALARRTDGNGLKSSLTEYDFRGNPVKQTDEQSGAVSQTWYDAFGNRTARGTAWNGRTVGRSWEYDWAGRVIKEVNELGGVSETSYSLLGDVISRTDKTSGLTVTSEYDAAGRLAAENRAGSGREYRTEYRYDAWGNRTRTVYPDGSSETALYDLWGRQTNATDRFGYGSDTGYDENSRAVRVRTQNPGGGLEKTTEYDNAGNVTRESSGPVDPSAGSGQVPARITQYQYDNAGNVVRKIFVGAGKSGDIVLATEYDAFGNKIAETDGNSRTTRTAYDVLNRVTGVTDPENGTTSLSYTYESGGTLVETRSAGPVVTKSHTDGFGNKTRTVDGNGRSEYAFYNAVGKPVQSIDRNGNTNTCFYDAQGRQTASIDPYGKSLSNVFDAFGNAVKTVDKEGSEIVREFDWAGRVVRTVDALGNTAEYKFTTKTRSHEGENGGVDASGGSETEEYTDAEGNKTVTTRYGKQTLSFTDGLGNTTRYRYNAFMELTATVDPKGNTTRLENNRAGLKTKETTALGFETVYEYDNAGNVTLEKNAEGYVRTSYNGNNLPVRKEYSDGNIKSFAYDSLARLTAAQDGKSSYYYEYDNAGNMVRRTDTKNGETLEYAYDGNGNRTTLRQAQGPGGAAVGKTVHYRYDALNQIKYEAVISSGKTNIQVAYAYSPMGRIVSKEFSTGVKSTYQYDTIYRLKKIDNYSNKTAFFNSLEYEYDKVGNRTREISSQLSAASPSTGSGQAQIVETVQAFEYDAAYRLIAAHYGSNQYENFTYDSSGNRLTKTTSSNTVHYTYDNDNRLMLEQPVTGASVAYVYDRAGRIVKKTTGEKREYFKYDSRDLMTKYWVESEGVTTVTEYVYDVNNQRVAKTDTSDAPTSIDGRKRFVWDGDNILYEGPVFYLNNIMVNGYEAEIQELRIVTYLKDALGSVRGEVYDKPVNPPASNPDIKPFSYKTFEYSAFGQNMGDNAKEGIGYTGHYQDKESSLYYARARYYNPETGRFITSDPIRDAEKRYSPAGLNRYIYGINNPVKYTDPYGEYFFWDDLAAAIIGGITGLVRGLLTMDFSDGFGIDDFLDPLLGTVSGAVSGLASYYTMQYGGGTTVDFFLTTKGLSSSVGWMGMAGVGYNIGFRNGGSFGLTGYLGWKIGDTGIGVGLEGGINYSQRSGFGGSLGFGVNFGSSGGVGTSGSRFGLSAGVNWSQENGYEGFYTRGSVSTWGETGGSVNAATGVSFDRMGQVNGFNINAGVGYRGWNTGVGVMVARGEDGSWQVRPDLSLHFDAQQAQAWQQYEEAKKTGLANGTVGTLTTSDKAETDKKNEAKILRDQTRTYILSLKDRGLSETTVNGYITKLDSLSDDQLLANKDKFQFSDTNQRNNLTTADDASLKSAGKNYKTPDIMCYPTSVAGALSGAGVSNPLAALGIQYEDFLDDLMRNDKSLSDLANGTGFRPRETGKVEAAMINKYFGDQVKVERFDGWAGLNKDMMIKRFGKLSDKLDNGTQIIISTRLPGGGHVVRLVGVDDKGVYVTDPWGKPQAVSTVRKGLFSSTTEYNISYQKNTKDMDYTYGNNQFIPYENARASGVGEMWYMTIDKK